MKLNELLDKIYELEGLLHLAIKRDDNKGDILRLISLKGKELGAICETLDISTHTGTESRDLSDYENPKEHGFSIEEYSLDDEYSLNGEIGRKELEDSSSLIEKSNGRERGKLVFSVNERFRFKRELFNNSDADFNTTLALVASMENYEEAEEYFLNEENLDPRNQAVKEFLEIIKKYFK